MLSPRWGSRSSTSGPTSSRAWAARRTSTTSGCATGARSRRTRRELFQDAVARRVGRAATRSTASTRWSSRAGLTWRQATVLRAYAKYMRQGDSPFAQDYIEDALRNNVDITRLLVQLFEARFDPGRNGTGRRRRGPHRAGRGDRGADHPRPRRRGQPRPRPDPALLPDPHPGDAAHQLLPAARRARRGGVRSYISFKLEPTAIPDLPEPRPRFEIFVYSPRVEGVHLRFGAVARGGLRWSDRRDDFRTEVLGLVKAQMVKNTVIVPVGAKGGFFCKQLPDPGDRDAWMAEGIACYKTFICGLLDITDNLVDGETVPPRAVVRHDGDDSYLVVAADKGTATFSDIANGVAAGLRLLARRRVRLRRLGGLRPQGDGHHRPRRVGVGAAALPRAGRRLPGRGLHRGRHRRHVRRRVRQRHAAAPSTPGWSPRSTTATSSSTRRRTRRRRTPSGAGCSTCPARAGRTTTAR